MVVDVIGAGRVDLDDSFFCVPEQVFDLAHEFPRRCFAAFRPEADADMLPPEAVGRNHVNGTRFPGDGKAERAVVAIGTVAG